MGLPKGQAEDRFRYGDYRNWPEDERWELIEGVPYDMCAAPNRFHQKLAGKIFIKISLFLEEGDCEAYMAPFDVLLPALGEEEMDEVSSVVQPDLSVICDPEKLIDQGCFRAPELLVEVLSPSTSKKDLNEKFNLYEKHGVREYWVVDPGMNYIRVFHLGDKGKFDDGTLVQKGQTAESKVLEGFALPWEDVFEAGA